MPERPHEKPHEHPWKRAHAHWGGIVAGLGSQPNHPEPGTPNAPPVPYAELLTTSNFTFLTGASHPDELVARAKELGHSAAAICDLHTLAGIVRAHVAAKEHGLPLAIGAQVQVPNARVADTSTPRQLDIFCANTSLSLYPTDRASYGRLCRLLTIGKRRAPKGRCHLSLHDVLELSPGLLCVVRPPRVIDESFIETLQGLARVFDRDRLSLAAAFTYGHDDQARVEQLADLCAHTGVPMVATSDVLYHDPSRRPLQDVLTCIKHTLTIEQAGLLLEPSAERHLKSGHEMRRLFAPIRGGHAAVARAAQIASRASAFSLDQLRYQYPDEVVPPGKTPMQHLTDLVLDGAERRYAEVATARVPSRQGARMSGDDPALDTPSPEHPNISSHVPPAIRAIIAHELRLIDELDYAPYFLTVHDLVAYARSRGILCQGRGAAANSAVCYCLGVTSVDPTKIDLLFERFISKERNEPPDIDIDFEHERREEVIQYIYAKYGRHRAALTAEVVSYRGRSAIREVGKALGLSLDLVDRLAKSLDWWEDGKVHDDRLRELGLEPSDRTLRLAIDLATQIQGFPRHLSQHVGGFVITRGDLCESVPIENAAMPDRTIIEWDKDDIEALGMLKIDVLGLGMLSALSKAMGMVNDRAQVSRCPGAQVVGGERQAAGEAHVQHPFLPRPDRLAAEQASGSTGVQSDRQDAQIRDSWPHGPDAPGLGVHPLQHRPGLQPQDAARVHPGPADRQRLAGRVVHAVGDPSRTGVSGGEPADREPAHGDRPRALLAHPQTGGLNIASVASTSDRAEPLPAASIHACALDTSPPRHLDTFIPLQLHTIPQDDPAVYDMACAADTIGVFQIESRAQMSMLPRLKPRCFYDLVIEVALVRPGPIVGDMVHPYLRRRDGIEPVVFPDDKIRQVLGKTLGVPLFQEQAMKLAMVAAGFTPGEADQLRRAIAAWKTKQKVIYGFGVRIIEGMVARGYARDFAQRCFDQLKGFSEYGFPESHAASFANLVYASLWLKRHHPAEFCAALINSQPMGFYAPAQLVRDAQDHGVTVRRLDVAQSHWDCTIEPDGALRLGLRLITGLRRDQAEQVIAAAASAERSRPDLTTLWRRSGVKVHTLRLLAGADAFGSWNLSRQQALWEIRGLKDEVLPLFDGGEAQRHEGTETHSAQPQAGYHSVPSCLRASVPPETPLPTIPASRQVAHDYAATGLSLKAHPIGFMRDDLAARGVAASRTLKDPLARPHASRVRVAGIVLVRQRPSTAKGVVFMTIEDETGSANLIIRPDVFRRFRKAARHSAIVVVDGRVQRQGLVVHVMVRTIHDAGEFTRAATDPMPSMSRDFR